METNERDNFVCYSGKNRDGQDCEYFGVTDAQFAVTETEGKRTVTGYALVWNVVSSGDKRRARLMPDSAKFDTPTFALYHHDFTKPLARTDNGTLRMTSDHYGVKVEIDLPETTAGKDAFAEIKTGLTRGMSFSMLGPVEYDTTDERGIAVKNYKSYRVDEVTITPIPAFKETSIGVKPDEPAAAAAPADELQLSSAKELDAERLKLEKYRVGMYGLDL